MKKFIVSFLLLVVIFGQSYVSSAEDIDRIIAIVNDDVITLSELQEEGQSYLTAIRANAPPHLVDDQLSRAKKEILTRLIDQLLIRQEGEKFGIQVSDEEVTTTIDTIMAENRMSAEQFSTELKKMGTSMEAYRKNIYNQIVKSNLVNHQIHSKIVITDKKIEDYYTNQYNKASSSIAEGYHILQTGFLWGTRNPSAQSKEQTLQKAEKIHDLLLEGKDFKELAKAHSDLPSAEDGGDIGIIQEDEMAEYMQQAIKRMNPGEISNIIATPSGYQILKLISARIGNDIVQAPLFSVKNDIKNLLYQQERDKNYQQWIRSIRDKAFIKEKL